MDWCLTRGVIGRGIIVPGRKECELISACRISPEVSVLPSLLTGVSEMVSWVSE
ncbi:hypothetical protein KDW_49500 [Dictyobacter vulcani]|uniref:Uncharacterized protein n=1 Tax=Dictyobacter vulcani TaxID=2607529 RepID=A0A5J4KM38_9CHLR|nr:hypothetical protein KDW_49500 [Dictyobacter vulcani]